MSSQRQPPAGTNRVHYLRNLGEDVDRGLELVVHDLVATNAMVREQAEAAVRIRAEGHLDFLRSSGSPVSAHEIAVWVAEAVQEDLIEGRGNVPPLIVWPNCPDHPNHPLWLRPRINADTGQVNDFDETWTCITAHRSVADLGEL